MTFDNTGFDDGEDDELTQQQLMNLTYLADLKSEILDRTITASKSAGEPPLESYRTSGIPRAELREIEGLTNNLRKTKSNMEAAYIELRKEEGDIGVIKDELERERARDEPDQNKIKHLEEEIRQKRRILLC